MPRQTIHLCFLAFLCVKYFLSVLSNFYLLHRDDKGNKDSSSFINLSISAFLLFSV